MSITLYYHFNAGFTGRVEGPMLLLEDAGIEYQRSSDFGQAKAGQAAAFAPPMCKDETGLLMSQTAAIMMHLGMKFGKAQPEKVSEAMRACLNAEDLWGEAYRPLKGGKDLAAGAAFANSPRLGKWFAALQGPLQAGGDYMFGGEPNFADYHVLSTIRTVREMYPKAVAALLGDTQYQALSAWVSRMESRPKVAAFFASDRCLPILYKSILGVA